MTEDRDHGENLFKALSAFGKIEVGVQAVTLEACQPLFSSFRKLIHRGDLQIFLETGLALTLLNEIAVTPARFLPLTRDP